MISISTLCYPSELNERLRRQTEYIKQLEDNLQFLNSTATSVSQHDSTTASAAVRCVAAADRIAAERVSSPLGEQLQQLLGQCRQLIKQFSCEKTLLSTLTLR
jgi:hypothetical protein